LADDPAVSGFNMSNYAEQSAKGCQEKDLGLRSSQANLSYNPPPAATNQ